MFSDTTNFSIANANIRAAFTITTGPIRGKSTQSANVDASMALRAAAGSADESAPKPTATLRLAESDNEKENVPPCPSGAVRRPRNHLPARRPSENKGPAGRKEATRVNRKPAYSGLGSGFAFTSAIAASEEDMKTSSDATSTTGVA